MNKYRDICLGVAAFMVLVSGAMAQPAAPALGRGGVPAGPPLVLTSTGFTDGGVIPDKYSQAVPNPVSPPLAWDNVPAGTASFTVIVHDPDSAPNKNSEDTLHWMIFNIPGTARSLPEGVEGIPQLTDGSVQGKNRGGRAGFMGMGARGVYHHYTFELFALDTKLALGPDASRADVLKAMDGHILAKAADEGRNPSLTE